MLRPQAVSRQIATAVATALGDERRSAGVDRALTVRTTRDANVAVRLDHGAEERPKATDGVLFHYVDLGGHARERRFGGLRRVIRRHAVGIADTPQRPRKRMRPRGGTDAAQARLNLLASIVECSGDAIIAKDLDGIITSWNASAEKMYGYSSEEAIGKIITLILPKDRPDEMAVILRKIRDGQRLEHYETLRVRKDGTAIPVSLTVSPIRDADGAIIGASSIAHDIIDRKRSKKYTATRV